MVDETRGGDGQSYGWEGEPDLTDLSEEELRSRLKALSREEQDLSYRRRVLQGRIDLIRVELVRRGGTTLTPQELARVLAGGGASSVPGALGDDPEGEG